MTEKEILDRLNNDEDYYGEFGKQYLSQSKIGTIINEPYLFYNDVVHDHLSIANFEFGTYFHALMLEPYKAELYDFVDVKSRRTKKRIRRAIKNCRERIRRIIYQRRQGVCYKI